MNVFAGIALALFVACAALVLAVVSLSRRLRVSERNNEVNEYFAYKLQKRIDLMEEEFLLKEKNRNETEKELAALHAGDSVSNAVAVLSDAPGGGADGRPGA